ncbi:MAG: MerR family transcriptional regulator [Actinobacteria bacterium]|nr:MAG: MerR family transcriptional regulator [Actinomycetota bacterium]
MARDEGMTIDQLAHSVGMTVRNVRAHQARGLLAPPTIRGRTGYYGPEHVARLELIKDLQSEGFNLESIRRIVDRTPAGSTAEVLDFTRALTAPFTDEQPQVVSLDELRERWGEQLTPELARRILELGFVRSLGDERFEVLSPRLERGAEELVKLGLPLEAAVEVTGRVGRHVEAVARVYVNLFLEYVWRPFERAGEPEEEWPRVRETLDRLRPLAAEAVLAIFGLTMTREVEQALERELAQLGRPERPQRATARRAGAGRPGSGRPRPGRPRRRPSRRRSSR